MNPVQRVIDSTKAECLLGYAPRLAAPAGMKMQVDWFREHRAEIERLNPGFALEDGG